MNTSLDIIVINFRLFLSLFDALWTSLWQQFVLRIAIFVSLLRVYIKTVVQPFTTKSKHRLRKERKLDFVLPGLQTSFALSTLIQVRGSLAMK